MKDWFQSRGCTAPRRWRHRHFGDCFRGLHDPRVDDCRPDPAGQKPAQVCSLMRLLLAINQVRVQDSKKEFGESADGVLVEAVCFPVHVVPVKHRAAERQRGV